MKIIVKKLIDQEIESPEFPFYLVGDGCAYIIIDEHICLSVTNHHWPSMHTNYPTRIPIEMLSKGEVELSNEGTFAELYKIVLTKIEESL
jgi:hypothetical protein